QASGSPGVQENGNPRLRDLLPQGGEAREFSWQGEHLPARLVLAWRPYRPELEVDAVVDLTLFGTQAQLRQRLSLQFGATTPPRILLDVPAGLVGKMRVREGGALADPRAGGEGACWVVLKNVAGKQHHLVVEYACALPSAMVANEENPD